MPQSHIQRRLPLWYTMPRYTAMVYVLYLCPASCVRVCIAAACNDVRRQLQLHSCACTPILCPVAAVSPVSAHTREVAFVLRTLGASGEVTQGCAPSVPLPCAPWEAHSRQASTQRHCLLSARVFASRRWASMAARSGRRVLGLLLCLAAVARTALAGPAASGGSSSSSSNIISSAGSAELYNGNGDIAGSGAHTRSRLGASPASRSERATPPNASGTPCYCAGGPCSGDVKAFCKDVSAGEGRIAACLTERLQAQKQGNVAGESLDRARRWQSVPLLLVIWAWAWRLQAAR